ncbi:MAG: GTPase HflX [Lachnospiraceae bacterium]|nr:GTPase HflX [Lachnospiraceae bacterium]MBR0434948.1 GTPase HflX [Lachnospiraceae bacterium]
MSTMYENAQKEEKIILVAVCLEEGDDTMDSVDELAELIKTAGATVVGRVIQNREQPHPGYYVGTGKIEELRELILKTDASAICCDDELSPAQIKNLENELHVAVLDRTLVILDIFAKHASTGEGKIQVELAQLRYRATRLSGLGRSLSRQGGGIGTKGPGEKKLEVDRRLIKNRISILKNELAEIVKHREITRVQREASHTKVCAIVGYTNAGKSTLLNHLTNANVLSEDMLFATLDPTTRELTLESGQKILLTDTVGFIRKLPHHLIQAFKSTLEEAKYADYIIHVVDASNPQMEKQMQIVYETLNSLGVNDKKVLTLFNKLDLVVNHEILKDIHADKTIAIEAKNNVGLDKVKEALEEFLRDDKVLLEKVFHYEDAGKIQLIRKYGELLIEEYREDGIYVKALVPKEMYNI